MSLQRWLWLILALLGTIWPGMHFVTWFNENGFDPAGMIDAWQVNAATRGAAVDLLVSAIVLSLWIVSEVAVRRNWIALIAIPATFLIGVSCGLPLYLFLRTRPVT